MFVYIDYYKGEEIRLWLFIIVYNVFIDWYWKEKKYKIIIVEEFYLLNVLSIEYEYFVKYEIVSWLDSLYVFLFERWNVLLLWDYYGFFYKEIVEMIGFLLVKVKIELYRGWKDMKSIKEWYGWVV